jgi:Spy/CpxP family protein refolding chaperone
MKRLTVSILLLFLLTSAAWAGRGGGSGNAHANGIRAGTQIQQQRMIHAQQRLGLSEAQMKQIRSIRENGGNREEIRSVLTEEQRAMMDAHRANRQGRGPANDGEG